MNFKESTFPSTFVYLMVLLLVLNKELNCKGKNHIYKLTLFRLENRFGDVQTEQTQFRLGVALNKIFIKVLIGRNVNISNELYFSDVYRSKHDIYTNPFGIHSLCTRSNVVCTSINPRKMSFIPLTKQ